MSPCPFPTTITITPRAPPVTCLSLPCASSTAPRFLSLSLSLSLSPFDSQPHLFLSDAFSSNDPLSLRTFYQTDCHPSFLRLNTIRKKGENIQTNTNRKGCWKSFIADSLNTNIINLSINASIWSKYVGKTFFSFFYKRWRNSTKFREMLKSISPFYFKFNSLLLFHIQF